MFRPLIILTLTFVVSLFFNACKENTVKKESLDKTLKVQKRVKPKRKFKVNNPFKTKELNLAITNHLNTYFIYKGEEKGLEFELIKLYAKSRGFKLKINVLHQLDGFQDSLKAQELHLAAATFGIPKKEDSTFLMSDELYTTTEVLVRTKETLPISKVKRNVEVPIVSNLPYMKSLFNEKIKHIKWIPAKAGVTKQMLVEGVAKGKQAYAICSRNEAEILQIFYPNLVIDEVIDPKFKVALVFNGLNKKLRMDFNAWLAQHRNSSDFQWTIKKYNKLPNEIANAMRRRNPEVFDDEISDFDKKIQARANEIGWDWRLMSALIFQESKFNPKSKSWVGALGLMQIMPRTAKQFVRFKSKKVLFNPELNLQVGSQYLAWIEKYFFKDSSIAKAEKQKFIIASYNCGMGHVADARALALKHGLDPNVWKNNVEKMILAKSQPMYYKDKVCKHGYCRGVETVQYVENILSYYNEYKRYVD
jgi:membrane-bound lytic murein transglycosylase F